MPIILSPTAVTPASPGVGATYTKIRQYGGREAGRFLASTVSNGTATVSSQSLLVDTSSTITSGSAGAQMWKDYFLYRLDAANQSDKYRRVFWYTPSQIAGTLQPDQPWLVAPANGERYELHGTFDPLTDWPLMINDGLRRCMLPVEFSFTPTALQTRHDLTAITGQSWLTDPLWVRQVGYLSQGDQALGRNLRDPYALGQKRGDPYLDAATGHVFIYHGMAFNATDTVYVTALKPLYFHVKPAAGGNYGDQTGMSAEGDSVPADVEWPAYAALCEGWRRLLDVAAEEARGHLLSRLQVAAASFARWDPCYAGRVEQTFTPIRRWGPRR